MPDADLAALRLRLAPAVAEAALFDGWTDAAVRAAALATGTDEDVALLAFGGAPMAMIAAWIAATDAAMVAAWPAEKLHALKIRERIRVLVEFRLDAVAPCRESLRRALAIMASPRHAPKTLRLGWHSADVMWRLAGDTAADLNHYTKRATLAAVYAATLAVLVDDESAGQTETRAFLARRIDGIMRFEKAKARLLAANDHHFSPTRFLGRLRYPDR